MATRIIARCFNEEQINLIKKDFEDYNVVLKNQKKILKMIMIKQIIIISKY